MLIAPDVILTAEHCGGFCTQVHRTQSIPTIRQRHPIRLCIVQSLRAIITLNADTSVPKNDKYLTVAGYGVTVEGVQSGVLREVDNDECDGTTG